MIKAHSFIGAVALCALLAACSEGEEQKAADPAPTAAPVAAEPAAPAASATPAKDDLSTLDGTQLASFTGNAAAGKLVFAQCRACHVTDAGVNRLGPSLAGIVGRTAGTVSGFSYSPANANSDIVWTKEKLFQFLEKPQRIMPKTKMIFAGLPDAQKRADVIAYLEAPN